MRKLGKNAWDGSRNYVTNSGVANNDGVAAWIIYFWLISYEIGSFIFDLKTFSLSSFRTFEFGTEFGDLARVIYLRAWFYCKVFLSSHTNYLRIHQWMLSSLFWLACPARYSEGHLCAGGEVGKDTCNGDSGGPLVITSFHSRTKNLLTQLGNAPWFIIGLTSYGKKNCGGGDPGVYTR